MEFVADQKNIEQAVNRGVSQSPDTNTASDCPCDRFVEWSSQKKEQSIGFFKGGIWLSFPRYSF